MKRKLLGLGVVAAMLLSASSAMAAPGVNILWNNCFGEGLGTNNKTFACGANTGSNIMVTSFIVAEDMTLVSGNELVIDLLSTSNPLPAWWEMKDVGTCRQNSLGFNVTANASDAVCVDWAAGQSAGGIGAYTADINNTSIPGSVAAQHRRIKIALAVPLAALADLFADGTEYFSCNITVNNQKTVGTGACAGCSTPVCIVFNSIKVTTNTPGGAGDRTLSGPADGANSDKIFWQGAGQDCSAVPTKNVTWGSVKALYR